MVAATNRPDSLDEALRRPGRFDREVGGPAVSEHSLWRSCMLANVFINGHQGRQECSPNRGCVCCKFHSMQVEVGVPPPVARRDILNKQLASIAHSLTPDQVGGLCLRVALVCRAAVHTLHHCHRYHYAGLGRQYYACTRHGQLSVTRVPPPRIAQVAALADAAHGFVAADLAALCSEAAMIALRRLVAQSRGSSDGDANGGSPGGTPCVTLADFQAAEARVRPSAMRELAFEVPKVRCRHGLRLFCVVSMGTGNWWL